MARRREPNLGTMLSLGSGVAGLVIGGLAVGWFLDSRIGSSPLITFIGLAAGIIAACLYTYTEMKKLL